ncbi:TPA: ribose 5-phosphate isomerase B [Campylobacter lari]|uniref:Allose-6-phosphate isomerase / ribose-5-phosphate isomerase B n=1 Tax=Campylobacter lari (strain RM2100 / D67 / ATCC BAA-1060) TaxID=306263 RepID=B9KG26_CAMLR|nr:ribose 5-phosphate isomerase B [Campylobacter lari]ACM64011.1 allose-6-phosphate isomerase / ribose-5-phosphate isomerase B [Campylobacter lari RM2100]EAH5176879.1 ribose 5-phosphate isomerase B [Campylobacter lari]EAH6261653.1 ribose 5-phosphate isomerase B [Campylobacter lari]EAH6292352.1 ribose 5-phosphate isomerase B [Campylobacter lari]EAH7187802.1 ribose 5-phosphate isomerase B [Campylobacter lari]
MLREKIYIASDHAGFILKQEIINFLQEKNISFEDLGPFSNDRCDYPDYAHLLSSKINETSFGILVCGSGIGMSIAANRHTNIRCALCNEPLSAKLSREHNDANVLALGSRLTGIDMAFEIINNFINTSFSGGRHCARISKIEAKL